MKINGIKFKCYFDLEKREDNLFLIKSDSCIFLLFLFESQLAAFKLSYTRLRKEKVFRVLISSIELSKLLSAKQFDSTVFGLNPIRLKFYIW